MDSRKIHRRFREILTECCSHQFSWMGTRDPNFCPECGAQLLLSRDRIRFKTLIDTNIVRIVVNDNIPI